MKLSDFRTEWIPSVLRNIWFVLNTPEFRGLVWDDYIAQTLNKVEWLKWNSIELFKIVRELESLVFVSKIRNYPSASIMFEMIRLYDDKKWFAAYDLYKSHTGISDVNIDWYTFTVESMIENDSRTPIEQAMEDSRNWVRVIQWPWGNNPEVN